jgi:thiol-disulfide isomerase/thioredoxin
MKKLVFHIIMMIIAVTVVNAAEQSIINFTATDIDGRKITLSDFNNKVVILDFWATWCPPCRQEIPNLIDIKNTYKNKNFEIISVDGFERNSDDAAVKFVKENKMNWIHIIDRKVGSDLADKYKIQYIPTMYLIKNGKIVATGLRGEELKKKVGELLQSK